MPARHYKRDEDRMDEKVSYAVYAGTADRIDAVRNEYQSHSAYMRRAVDRALIQDELNAGILEINEESRKLVVNEIKYANQVLVSAQKFLAKLHG